MMDWCIVVVVGRCVVVIVVWRAGVWWCGGLVCGGDGGVVCGGVAGWCVEVWQAGVWW